MEPKTWVGVTRSFAELSDRPFWIDEQAGITVTDIRSRARRWRMNAAKTAPRVLVVVDYIGLIQPEHSSGQKTREREVAEVSAGLKALAKEINCPVVALSQLNRSCETRADKRPMLSDLRESGAIEQDADVITFLYRDEVYNEKTEDKGIAEIIVAKQRNGPTATLKLAWRAQSSKFVNLSTREQN
jgi:replicative DNA helicase